MTSSQQAASWSAKNAYILACICLAIGIVSGFIAHGPVKPEVAPTPVAVEQPEAVQPGAEAAIAPPVSTPDPSPEQLQAASNQAAMPVLEMLKKDPKNFKLLVAAGEMYYHHGAYDKACGFYERALKVEDNVLVRNQYASALFYEGKADAAIQQYEQVLKKVPTNDVALFNDGMIRMEAKQDKKTAVVLWKKLLAAHPDHPQKERVQHLIDTVSKEIG